MAFFNFGAGASVPFKRSLAIVVYGSLPGIIGAALGIVSMFAGVDPGGFNAQSRGHEPGALHGSYGKQVPLPHGLGPGCVHPLEHRSDWHWFRLQQQSEAFDGHRNRRLLLSALQVGRLGDGSSLLVVRQTSKCGIEFTLLSLARQACSDVFFRNTLEAS